MSNNCAPLKKVHQVNCLIVLTNCLPKTKHSAGSHFKSPSCFLHFLKGFQFYIYSQNNNSLLGTII